METEKETLRQSAWETHTLARVEPEKKAPPVVLITMADERFSGMMKVSLAAAHAWGGARDWPMAVYDFGLGKESREYCAKQQIEVRSLAEAKRVLLPVVLSGKQRTFDLWLCKAWAIHQAASLLNDPAGVVVWIDTDVLCLSRCGVGLGEYVEAARQDKAWAVAPDAMSFVQSVCSWNPQPFFAEPGFWRAEFGVDLPEPNEVETKNIGIMAARADVIEKTHETLIGLICSWPQREWAREIPCFDQLAFSILSLGSLAPVSCVDMTLNVTRPLWNIVNLAAAARIIHLTGPIKPWQIDGRLHPMTETWRRTAGELAKMGYFNDGNE